MGRGLCTRLGASRDTLEVFGYEGGYNFNEYLA